MENFNGYYFKMKYLAFGKWILDHLPRNLRLFKMNTGKFTNKMVHEKVVIKGEIGVMKNPILHFCRSYRSIEGYLSKQNRYASYTVNDLYNMGRRITFKNIFLYFVIKPIFVFFRKFILWGYKYGFRGFLLSALGAYDYFLSYAKLWEKQGKKSE